MSCLAEWAAVRWGPTPTPVYQVVMQPRIEGWLWLAVSVWWRSWNMIMIPNHRTCMISLCVCVCTCRRKIRSNGSSRFFPKKIILFGFSVLFAATSIRGIRLTLRAPKICRESRLILSAARQIQPLIVARPQPDLGHPVQTFVWTLFVLVEENVRLQAPAVYMCVCCSTRAGWEPTAYRRSKSQLETDTARPGWDSKTWVLLGSWNEGPFHILIYMNSYLFVSFIFFVKNIFRIWVLTYLTLSLADTHKSYCHRHTKKEWQNTRSYKDTHTHTHKKEQKRNKKQ